VTVVVHASGPQIPVSRRWLGLVFIGLAVAMTIADITIVNVAIPPIIKDLGVSATTAQWVQEIYVLGFAALLLTFGRLADRLGRRATLIIGVHVFTLASVFAAVASSGGALLAARGLQGLAAAAIFPATLSLISATFEPAERPAAFAVWGSLIGGMAALGPLLGGWLSTEHSWRWAFGINVPLGLVVIVGLLFTVAESWETDQRGGVDVVGAVLSVLAVGLLVFALTEAPGYGWWTVKDRFAVGSWKWPNTQVLSGSGWEWRSTLSPIPVAIALTVIAVLLFARWQVRQNRRGGAALLDLSLFSIPTFARGSAVVLMVSLGEFGLLFAIPLWLQYVLGYSPFGTGLILVAMAGGSFVAGGVAAALAVRIGPVQVLRIGLLLEIVGINGIGAVMSRNTPLPALLTFLAVYGIGVGFATAQLSGVVLSDVPVARSGQASGTASTAQQIGSALGIAVLGTVLFSTLAGDLRDRLGNLPAAQRDQVVNAVRTSGGAAIEKVGTGRFGAQIVTASDTALSNGVRYAAFTAAAFLVFGLLASLTLPHRALTGFDADETDLDRPNRLDGPNRPEPENGPEFVVPMLARSHRGGPAGLSAGQIEPAVQIEPAAQIEPAPRTQRGARAQPAPSEDTVPSMYRRSRGG
jgi:MFS family permease